ncbi:MAG: hypothetical protein Q8933_11245 [Bacteroidota bacterium]|nr:hypothetical protein [Bacteroidota bacterium]
MKWFTRHKSTAPSLKGINIHSQQSELFLFVPIIVLINILTLRTDAQTINYGLWYHQQPTIETDSNSFYGGSERFEGFCGPTAVTMALHYFIPNIHSLLYKIYGSISFHSDKRGGLKSSDPYCYDPYYTYTFEDLLGHRYIGRHISKTGCSYSELEKILKGIASELNTYSLMTNYIRRDQICEFLDKGYLIVMNSKQEGGHYILIGGWDYISSGSNGHYYYIWDGWKKPCGLDTSEYIKTIEYAGNKANIGTAKTISTYKITDSTLNKIFKDQLKNGTMLAFKLSLFNLPQIETKAKAKGIRITGLPIKNENAEQTINNLASHGITDLFLSSGNNDKAVPIWLLTDIIEAAHKKEIKVHLNLNVLSDDEIPLPPSHQKLNRKDKLDTDSTAIENIVINKIKPLLKLNIDGISLDFHDRSYRPAGNASGDDLAALSCSIARKYLDANSENHLLLSASISSAGDSTYPLYSSQINKLSQYLNFIIPVVNAHRYNLSPAWMGMIIPYYLNNVVPSCKIWAEIQTLDDQGNFNTSLEIKQSIIYALSSGSDSIIFSHYPPERWQWETNDKLFSADKLIKRF